MGLSGSIFITGGTGSLGQAIARRAHVEQWDCALTILSRDEVKQGEMRAHFPGCRYLLGDVRDREWLQIAMRGHDLVVHAAAYKQVPSAEANAGECIKTNVIGSLNVANAAVAADIRRVVGISTDKACAPINLYGESKACMEKLFQQANGWGATTFTLCRYGNVIGSRGSVIPLFQRQARAGRLLTVTDRRMTRFWLTIREAVDLILKAATAAPGAIVVPKAPAMAVEDVALAVLAIETGVDPATVVRESAVCDIGIRPGEKIHEALVHAGEAQHAVEESSHFIVHPASEWQGGSALPLGFEYTSERARALGFDEMRAMIAE